MGRIEVITSVERRRRWPRAEKERLVAAMMEPDASVADIARKAGVDPSLLYRWRQQLAASNDILYCVPVMVTPPPERVPELPPATITIEFEAHIRMKIEGAPDPETLAKTVDALAGRRR